jgi:hypothetical protein
LDNQVIEFFAGLPEHYRYHKNLYRFTLTSMFGDLMTRIPIAGRNSLEDWGSSIRTEEHRQYILNHLVKSESPIHEIWAPDDIASAVERFYSAVPVASLRTRTFERAKNLLRQNALPVYRVLKNNLPAAAVVRVLPPEFLLGRLLILKLWCDRWAR